MTRSEPIELEPPVERAFLIAVETGADGGWSAEDSLAELASLAGTAGADVVGAEWQRRRHVDPNWYLGKGKAEELRVARDETGFTVLVADDELSPNQQKALESLLSVKVLDRSGLILDIFAQHAQTREGRLQVELAQLEYLLPRLTRLWTHLSRTGGGIGTRGPGETQLETDRRVIRTRIKKLKERVEQVAPAARAAGRARDRRLVPSVAIVGYTNAGKSTLLNALTGAEAARPRTSSSPRSTRRAARSKLGRRPERRPHRHRGLHPQAAPSARRCLPGDARGGHRADLLVEVVDGADAHAREHRETVAEVLDELGAGGKPPHRGPQQGRPLRRGSRPERRPAPVVGDAVPVSAVTGYGLTRCACGWLPSLAELWEHVDVRLSYAEGELLARVRERGTVEMSYLDTGVHVVGRVAPTLAGELRAAAARGQTVGAETSA